MTTTWKCWRDASHPVGQHRFGWPQCETCQAAPPYHERPHYVPADLALDVFIPAGPATRAQLVPGTAIVGIPSRMDSYVLVHFEGWLYGAAQYAGLGPRGQWEAGLLHAADRMVTAYPTSATAHYPADSLLKIGTYDVRAHKVTVEDEVAVNGWLGIQTGIENVGVEHV